MLSKKNSEIWNIKVTLALNKQVAAVKIKLVSNMTVCRNYNLQNIRCLMDLFFWRYTYI